MQVKVRVCTKCNEEFELTRGKPGLVGECPRCATEPVPKVTGNMIYEHKTGGQIQINDQPELTRYINRPWWRAHNPRGGTLPAGTHARHGWAKPKHK